MNPHSIYLRNVRTFDEVRLDLPLGLLAIIGQNGAGKSTLISAIDVALFGPEGRSLAPWYPRGPGVDPLTIELVFEHGGELYRVRRSFSPKGRGVSKCELERASYEPDAVADTLVAWEPLTLESQTATQEQIEQVIGLSRATFRASSYLAQGDAGAFCDAQPRDRKAILSEVVGLADWERWLERARVERRGLELHIAQARAVLERADAELAQREPLELERAAAEAQETRLREQLSETVSALATAREALAEAQQRAERRNAAERAHKAAQAAVAELGSRIAQREGEISGLDVRLAARDELAERADSLPALQEEQITLQSAVTVWQERVRRVNDARALERTAVEQEEHALRCDIHAARVLEHVGEEHCAACGQVLGQEAAEHTAQVNRAEAAEHRRLAAEARTELDALNQRIAPMPAEEPNRTRLAGLYDEIRQAQEASVRLAALDEAGARRVAAIAELDVMRAEWPIRESGAATALADVEALGPHDPLEVVRAQHEVDRLEWADQELRDKIEPAVRVAARCVERLDRLATIAEEADETRANVEEAVAELELRVALERACGANGIPALILESVAIPQVEMEASRLLRVLGGPATGVELRTQRETKTGGIADTLDIVLMTDTGEAPYESFSGGERARIAFAVRLALAQLLSGRKGADTGLLVVDEVEGLDAQGIAALVSVLEELQRSVPRIIVVSHQAELRDAFPQSLMLANVDGRSRILDTDPSLTPLEV